jgi:hypothetical protein
MNSLKLIVLSAAVAFLGCYFDIAVNFHPTVFHNILFVIGDILLAAGLSIERKI